MQHFSHDCQIVSICVQSNRQSRSLKPDKYHTSFNNFSVHRIFKFLTAVKPENNLSCAELRSLFQVSRDILRHLLIITVDLPRQFMRISIFLYRIKSIRETTYWKAASSSKCLLINYFLACFSRTKKYKTWKSIREFYATTMLMVFYEGSNEVKIWLAMAVKINLDILKQVTTHR